MNVTLKSWLIGVARKLTSADYHEIQTHIWPIRLREILKDILEKKN